MATKDIARTADRTAQLQVIIDELEGLNGEARNKDLWIRTKWNTPTQKPWHLGESGFPGVKPHGLAPDHRQPVAHVWKWSDIEPYLKTLADLCPLELTERQSVLLTNPSFGTQGMKVCNTMRVAISIYKPGDDATPHLHSPNASRTILSEQGGYTVVEGEHIPAARGDLILTPNGTWHQHGNSDKTPVFWADILDWPLMDFLGCVEVRNDYENAPNAKPDQGFSGKLYGGGGIKPLFAPFGRGYGDKVTPMFHFKGVETRARLNEMKAYDGDPYEGINIEFVDPVNARPVWPTFSYRAQLLRPDEKTRPFRHSASGLYCCLEGEGYTEVDGRRLEWGRNDFFMIPPYAWRRHVNTGKGDAVLYLVTDEPLYRSIGQYHAQGKDANGNVIEVERD